MEGPYIGDLGNPRGGPTPYGHAAHQTGLEVDIKFKKPESLNLSMKDSHNDHRYGKPSFKEESCKKSKKCEFKLDTRTYGYLKAAAKDERVNKIFVNAQ